MANAGAKLSSFPEVNDIQTGDMFPLLSGGDTNAKIDYATLADAIIAKLKSEAGDSVLSINGKTGAVTLAKGDVGLGNVDNTSDADKPVSTAVQNALDGKANNSVATSSADGLMSKADKAKLDEIGAGSNVKSVNGKTGAVTLAKGDVGLGNVANLDQSKAIKSITRSGTTFTATALDGTTTTFTQQDNDTTYGVATSSADGLMSKSDKAKLDGISSGGDAVTIKTVKVNGTALTPDSNKAVNVTVPTLANNATTTAGGMALDARMGKTLADQASQFAKNTAQIETAGTATNAHSVGEYVMISNALYKVTASVAKGDTWTIGTNVTAANVGSEIGSLKSDIIALNSSIMTINSSLATQSKFVRYGFPNAASVDIGNAANGNWLCGFIVCNIVNVGNFVGYFVFSGSTTATVTKIAGDWMTPALTISNGKIILSTSDYKIVNYVVLIND